MMDILTRLQRIRLLRYGAVSALALAVDLAIFLALLALAVPAVASSAIAYGIGIVTHWLFSSRTVFADTVAGSGLWRTRQKALFVGSALVGLAVTMLVVAAGELARIDPRLSKIVAVAVSFAATWLLRSRVVFRPVS